MKHPNIEKIILCILRDAADRKICAGMNGRYDDDGASLLETQVEYFRYGSTGVLPPAWAKYEKQALTESDPEYQKFLELKKKFE